VKDRTVTFPAIKISFIECIKISLFGYALGLRASIKVLRIAICLDMNDHGAIHVPSFEAKVDSEDGFLIPESPPMDPQEYEDYLVDQLQALNTALCFLCSVNACADEVDYFLKLQPEALLLEGACLLPEDSAHYILEQHMLRCKCQGVCRQNRNKVFEVINKGFEYFDSHRLKRNQEQEKSWNLHFIKLTAREREIRKLRREELLMRNTLLETAVELRSYQEELDRACFQQYKENQNPKHSALSILSCNTRTNTRELDPLDCRRNVLEYQVGVAAVNMRSVEREHAHLLQRIREGRRAQFALLKCAFEDCTRYNICTMKRNPISQPK
jgi:hypothetical protein